MAQARGSISQTLTMPKTHGKGGKSNRAGRGRRGRPAGGSGNRFAALAGLDDPAPEPAFQFTPSVIATGSPGAGAGSPDALKNPFSSGTGFGLGTGGAIPVTSSSFKEMAAAMAAESGVSVPTASVADFESGETGALALSSEFATDAPDAGASDGAQAWNFSDLAAKFQREKAALEANRNKALWDAAKRDAESGVLKARQKKLAAAESKLSKRVKERRKKMRERALDAADKTSKKSSRLSQKKRQRRRFRDMY